MVYHPEAIITILLIFIFAHIT